MSESRISTAWRGVSSTLAALSTNCSSFKQDWESSGAVVPGDPISGCWTGQWLSELNGHQGSLRCLLAPLENGCCRARFHARYASFLRVCYAVDLKMTSELEGYWFEGQTDLGRLAGGVYHYEGKIIGEQLECSYRCEYDFGAFHLARGRDSD